MQRSVRTLKLCMLKSGNKEANHRVVFLSLFLFCFVLFYFFNNSSAKQNDFFLLKATYALVKGLNPLISTPSDFSWIWKIQTFPACEILVSRVRNPIYLVGGSNHFHQGVHCKVTQSESSIHQVHFEQPLRDRGCHKPSYTRVLNPI